MLTDILLTPSGGTYYVCTLADFWADIETSRSEGSVLVMAILIRPGCETALVVEFV
jgi:hypothetical protein